MTTMATTPSHYRDALTLEGYERLQQELATLVTTARTELLDRIRDARAHGGEVADNLELIDALEDQDFLERRIATIETALGAARIVDHPPRDGTIGVGSRVQLHDMDRGRTAEYEVVSSVEADPIRRRLSIESPVGRALLGRRSGDVIEVEAPGGGMRFAVQALPGREHRRQG